MMLPTMPWCIDRVYQAGDVTITPDPGRLEREDGRAQRLLAHVFASYWDIQGRPVDHAAIFTCARKPFDADMARSGI
jgi:hypothetical protein